MSESTNLPELLPPAPRRPRWQFSLWYLFLLTTVAAAITGALRWLSDVPWLFVGMLIYVAGFACYLFLRLPWVLSRLSPERERVRENRRRLEQWAEKNRRS